MLVIYSMDCVGAFFAETFKLILTNLGLGVLNATSNGSTSMSEGRSNSSLSNNFLSEVIFRVLSTVPGIITILVDSESTFTSDELRSSCVKRVFKSLTALFIFLVVRARATDLVLVTVIPAAIDIAITKIVVATSISINVYPLRWRDLIMIIENSS